MRLVTCLISSTFITLFVYMLLSAIDPEGSEALSNESSKRLVSKLEEPKIEFLSVQPRIVLHHEFLTPAECDHIIAMSAPEVTRSSVSGKGGENIVSDYRTSYGAFIANHMDDPVIVRLADKIQTWTNIPKSHGETFYVLRYEKGQEYKVHTDWFAPTPEGLGFLGPAGNRLATVIVYLAEPEEGGETHFPLLDMKIRPKRGDALLFWNRTPDFQLDPLVQHSSLPVVRGIKWSITQWIRERPLY